MFQSVEIPALVRLGWSTLPLPQEMSKAQQVPWRFHTGILPEAVGDETVARQKSPVEPAAKCHNGLASAGFDA